MRTLTGGLLESEAEPRELSAEFVFHCPGFQHGGLLVISPALGFVHFLLPLWELSLLCLASSMSHGTIDVRRVYAPRFCPITTKVWSDGH